MNLELEAVLEQSIGQMAEGKARVDSCLLAYPALADELKPLLLVSEKLLSAPRPVLAPEAKARIEAQLLTAAAAAGLVRRERKRRRPLRQAIALPKWRLAYSALAAVAIVLLLMTTALVGSANALPGSPLYSVKLASEDVWLWVAPARDEPALHLRFAQRRLEEYQQLAEQGVYDEAILEAMTAHVDAAMVGIEELPPSIALVLLDQAEEVVAEQRQVLSGMLATVPVESRVTLDRFLAMVFAQLTRMQALRQTLLPYATATAPVPDLTLVPTDTEESGEIPTATSTPDSEESPAPTSTETVGGTEPGEPTSGAPTETSVPSTSPSSTPEPPEEEPTQKIPPGQTKIPPGQLTKTVYP
jgi:hypothetical protein